MKHAEIGILSPNPIGCEEIQTFLKIFQNYNFKVIFLKPSKAVLLMKFSELYKKLERAGWQIERTKKHHIYVHPEKKGVKIPVGRHSSHEIPTGTLKSILKQAGLQ